MFSYGVLLGALAAIGVWLLVKPALPWRGARTLTVTAPATVNETVAAAQAGDTVVLSPGTYAEVVHLKDGVNLVAQKRREAVIEGSLLAEDGVHARVEGIRVRAADLGIVVQDSDVTLLDDEVSAAQEAGVKFLGASHGVVTGCYIHENAGVGLVVLDTAEASIRNNVITANGTAAGRLRPGLLIRSPATMSVTGNIFAGNGAEAVWVAREDPLLLQKNAFALGANGDKHALIRVAAHGEIQP